MSADKPAMSNPNGSLNQKLCQYLNQSPTLMTYY